MDIIFLKYMPAIFKALGKNQTSMGSIAIGICFLIYWLFLHTSAHVLRKTSHCLTHVVLLVLTPGLCEMIFIQNYVTDLQMSSSEPFPVGITVSKIILLSIYCLSRQSGGIFKIPLACFHFAGIRPNQKKSRLSFSGKLLSNLIRHISHSR